MNYKKILVSLIPIILILAIASFFRLWKLDTIPPGLYPDVAVNGTNALDSIKNSDFKIFYPDNNGREGLIMWLDALAFIIFGPSIWSLRIACAIIGIITILGIYLFTKFIFEKSKGEKTAKLIALLSAFFTAISFFHVNFSRIGFRAIMVPFFAVFGIYFLLKGFQQVLRSPAERDEGGFVKYAYPIISGIFLGLGFYTYISYRFIVLLLALIIFWHWKIFKTQNLQKQFARIVLCNLIVIFIVALPIGIYFLGHPADFFGRASDVSIMKQANPLWTLAKALFLHLQMFNFYGDANWRHNYSASPMLLWPVGIFFAIGIILGIISIVKKQNKPYLLLFSFFLVFLLPGFLSGEGIPHALRVIGVIPPVFIFSGLGAYWVFEKLSSAFKHKMLFYALIFIFLSSCAITEFYKYFYDWAERKEVYAEFNNNLLNAGNFLNSLPKDSPKYVIANLSGVDVDNVSVAAQTPIFIERTAFGEKRAIYLKPEQVDQIKPVKGTYIVILKDNADVFMKLLTMFPKDIFYYNNGFWVFEIKNNY